MRILVTGSSGQIGTNLSLALLARGDEVTGVDRRENTWTDRIPTERIDLVEVGRGTAKWEPAQKPDVIVHLAAWAKVHQLVLEPQKALENVEMAFAALDLAQAGGSDFFGSSREVYGDIHRHITEESKADFVVAESPYSASKIAGEAFFYSYAKCYKLPHLVFRFSNVYGRYDNDLDRMERVIPLFVRRISRGEPIVVFGRNKTLDFTHIDDCVSGIVAGIDAIASHRVVNQTVNLAYGEGQTLQQLVEYIESAVGREAKVTYEEPLVGEVTRYVADINKARQMLGYSPTTSLSAGIPKYIRWWRENGWLND